MIQHLPTRVSSKFVQAPSGCWIWLASRNPAGYGSVGWEGRTQTAHRVVFKALVGPIPAGLFLDHLCRVRRCVNPMHLQPVTPKVNSQRGSAGQNRVNERRYVTHCANGHEYSPETLVIRTKRGRKYRDCGACARARMVTPQRREYMQKWRDDHRESVRAYHQEYNRARRAEARGHVAVNLRADLPRMQISDQGEAHV